MKTALSCAFCHLELRDTSVVQIDKETVEKSRENKANTKKPNF